MSLCRKVDVLRPTAFVPRAKHERTTVEWCRKAICRVCWGRSKLPWAGSTAKYMPTQGQQPNRCASAGRTEITAVKDRQFLQVRTAVVEWTDVTMMQELGTLRVGAVRPSCAARFRGLQTIARAPRARTGDRHCHPICRIGPNHLIDRSDGMSDTQTYMRDRQTVCRLLPGRAGNWRWQERMSGAQRWNHNATVNERIDCHTKAGISFIYVVGRRSLTVRGRSVASMADVSTASQRDANFPGRSVLQNGVLKRRADPTGRGSPVFILQYRTNGTVRAIPAHTSLTCSACCNVDATDRSCLSRLVLVCVVRKHANYVGVQHQCIRNWRIRKGRRCRRVAGEPAKRLAKSGLTAPSYLTCQIFIADLDREKESVYAAGAVAFDRIPHHCRLAKERIGTYLSGETTVDGEAIFPSPLKCSQAGTFLLSGDNCFGLSLSKSTGCGNVRDMGTLAQAASLSGVIVGWWLRHKDLVL